MDEIQRISQMEAYMDTVRAALDAVEAAREPLRALKEYYESGQWLADYERDEAGKLPPDLKRGVLSEDALWDLLCQWDELRKKTI